MLRYALLISGAAALVAPALPKVSTKLHSTDYAKTLYGVGPETSYWDPWASPTSARRRRWTSSARRRASSNLEFDPLGFGKSDPALVKTYKERELKNGRLAMIGIMGFVASDQIAGSVPMLA
ncbi:chlorophyll A-B binding protein [Aureococcus anophagefferens]|nr:chlorophyll A-B binding protein [Aureococcus anophagefferens]